eukprot:TRINITY_DN2197_c0_g1_i1.p2 TRINITY_DN2197_c0_g1~~TRINITY_DN2197_c0_g1_i1.p2  ORF type:complete len:290 (-),score=73.91 TRINITY_DN2197_c0_g1_i1:31-900(-)
MHYIALCFLFVAAAFSAECVEDSWYDFEECATEPVYDAAYDGVKFPKVDDYCTEKCFGDVDIDCIDENKGLAECDFVESCQESYDCVVEAIECVNEIGKKEGLVNWPECDCYTQFVECAEDFCGIVEIHTQRETITDLTCGDANGLGKKWLEKEASSKAAVAFLESEDASAFDVLYLNEDDAKAFSESFDDEDNLIMYFSTEDSEDAAEDSQSFCDEFAEFLTEKLAEDCNAAICEDLVASCTIETRIPKRDDTPYYFTATISWDFEGNANSVAVSAFAVLSVLAVFFF